jgi:hypothetical protein
MMIVHHMASPCCSNQPRCALYALLLFFSHIKLLLIRPDTPGIFLLGIPLTRPPGNRIRG